MFSSSELLGSFLTKLNKLKTLVLDKMKFKEDSIQSLLDAAFQVPVPYVMDFANQLTTLSLRGLCYRSRNGNCVINAL